MQHRVRELESLEIHRQVAALMNRAPMQVIGKARGTLQRWMSRSDAAAGNPAYKEWLAILDGAKPQEIATLITTDSPTATRLRQSSPFAGILSPRQVWAIKRESRHATP
jgi:hypothetical protein